MTSLNSFTSEIISYSLKLDKNFFQCQLVLCKGSEQFTSNLIKHNFEQGWQRFPTRLHQMLYNNCLKQKKKHFLTSCPGTMERVLINYASREMLRLKDLKRTGKINCTFGLRKRVQISKFSGKNTTPCITECSRFWRLLVATPPYSKIALRSVQRV